MASNANFAKYKAAYAAMKKDGGAQKTIDAMVRGWDAFAREVGKKKALAAFWRWQKKLPPEKQSDCDPDGGF